MAEARKAHLMSDDVYNALVAGERLGLSRRACAARAGISERTYWRWLEMGKRALESQEAGEDVDVNDEKHIKLWLETERARATWEEETLAALDVESDKGWQRQAWKLERRRPDDYALVTVQRNEGGPSQVSLTVVADAKALEMMDGALRQLTGGRAPAPEVDVELEEGKDFHEE